LSRSNAATLTAAFIVGLAILTLVYRPTGWQTWAGPVFAVAAAGALIVGFYLLFVTLRSLRK